MMKKNIFFAAVALVALVNCTSDERIGGEAISPDSPQVGQGAIVFSTDSKGITRAGSTGADAAEVLNKNFVVFGYKTVSSNPQTVFDNYQVNWVTNTAGTTESNSANWEYVGYRNLPFGTTTTSGGTLNTDGVAKNATGSSTNVEQSIKYWDFSASQYDFFAYSLGAGEADDADDDSDPQYAKASALSNSTYTLEGNAAQLGACYISNKKTVTPALNATQVDLEFRSFLTKIQLGFYETIPGYSVKDVQFYPSASGSSSTTPSLYTESEVLPNGGKYTVTFDANGKPQLALAASDPTPTKISKIDFSATLTNYARSDYKEASENYLGRASNAATLTDIVNVLPNPSNESALNLKMDFTLVSRDGTGETINMTGATAVIPAVYAQWKPNYKYTYIFKISDNTNVQSGSITGLYPITFDAVVADAQDGSQETITTVAEPSITTYAKASAVLINNEYLTGSNIYVVVEDATANLNPLVLTDANAKLYTATVEAGAVQGITEETVANALTNGTESPTGTWTVTDANGKKLVVTTASGLTPVTEIPAADSPTGVAITVNAAMFTPANVGTYVFEYTDGSSAKHYKIIKVLAGS
jgi:hypothetical protein